MRRHLGSGREPVEDGADEQQVERAEGHDWSLSMRADLRQPGIAGKEPPCSAKTAARDIRPANACHYHPSREGRRRAAERIYSGSRIPASAEVGMHPCRYQRIRTIWPSVIALLFAALATISFAVDQSVTLAPLSGMPDIE
jgi:hypothetical protein